LGTIILLNKIGKNITMNYLTNYYKNLSEKLQHQVDSLNNQHQMLSEALVSYGANRTQDETGYAPQPFSGQQLGQMLGSGNVRGAQSYVNSYAPMQVAGQASYRMAPAPGSNRGRGAASMGDSQGGFVPGDYNGDGRVDGADLGLALGSGQNPSNVVNNFSSGMQVGGYANRSMMGPNRGRGRGMGAEGAGSQGNPFGVGGQAGGAGSPFGGAEGAGAAGNPFGVGGQADGYGGEAAGQGGYSGEVLGQLLSRGDMDAVNRYLSQFVARPGNFGAQRKRRGY
jgi:hypothetical protein